MRIARLLMGALLGFLLTGAAAKADVLDDIKKRGTLIVGVKADYKPFGFRDPSGGIIGLEPDLAGDVAKKLGVKLELVPVVSANRMEFLNQGKIDLMIATMSDKPERRKVVQVIEPLYYSDACNILLRKNSPIKSWDDLKGKKLCGTTGAFYNKDIQQTYGPEIASFDGSEKPLLALKNNDCVGYVYDQTFIAGKLTVRRLEGRISHAPARHHGDALGGRREARRDQLPEVHGGHPQGVDEVRPRRRAGEEVGRATHRVRQAHVREGQERQLNLIDTRPARLAPVWASRRSFPPSCWKRVFDTTRRGNGAGVCRSVGA